MHDLRLKSDSNIRLQVREIHYYKCSFVFLTINYPKKTTVAEIQTKIREEIFLSKLAVN